MALDMGTGLAVCGMFITLTAAIIRFVPQRVTNSFEFKETCQVRHEGLNAFMEALVDEQKSIRQEIQSLTKAILKGGTQ